MKIIKYLGLIIAITVGTRTALFWKDINDANATLRTLKGYKWM